MIPYLSSESQNCIISFYWNFGHQAAFNADLDAANGDATSFDGDLHDLPDLILAMTKKCWENLVS